MLAKRALHKESIHTCPGELEFIEVTLCCPYQF